MLTEPVINELEILKPLFCKKIYKKSNHLRTSSSVSIYFITPCEIERSRERNGEDYDKE